MIPESEGTQPLSSAGELSLRTHAGGIRVLQVLPNRYYFSNREQLQTGCFERPREGAFGFGSLASYNVLGAI